MKQLKVARRYAQALMDMAEETKNLGRIVTDFELILQMIRESRELGVFLRSPVVKADRKRAILREIVGSQVHQTTQSFLDLLVEKGREDILDQIIGQFFELNDERLGIVSVDVKSATELDEKLRKKIEDRFVQLTKKSVRTIVHLDPQLKGGFVARLGDTVYDGSIKRQLELLRASFAEGAGQN
jgi:F-type H+-transporting ATPase subunit delta